MPAVGRPWFTTRARAGAARPSAAVSPVSIVETVLVFAVIPLGIYAVVALLTLRERVTKAPRYRPGQGWDYPPVGWTATPAGVGSDRAGFTAAPTAPASGTPKRTAKGGARGSW